MIDDQARFHFAPIGVIHSPYKEKFGTPRQPGLVAETEATITLRESLNPDIFDGLSGYSHAWLIFVFHENDSFKTGKPFLKTKIHPPRFEGQAVGVFASRSPHRPNPIGLSLVRILAVNGRTLKVSGVDLIDQTPILDIKPYLASIEAPLGAHEGWSAAARSEAEYQISWSQRALDDLARLLAEQRGAGGTNNPASKHKPDTGLANEPSTLEAKRSAIEAILRLDPRPIVYRGTRDNPDPYMNRYGFRFENWNVVFEMSELTDHVSSDTGISSHGSNFAGGNTRTDAITGTNARADRLPAKRLAQIIAIEDWSTHTGKPL